MEAVGWFCSVSQACLTFKSFWALPTCSQWLKDTAESLRAVRLGVAQMLSHKEGF